MARDNDKVNVLLNPQFAEMVGDVLNRVVDGWKLEEDDRTCLNLLLNRIQEGLTEYARSDCGRRE